MITARLTVQDNGSNTLLVEGHAGYAPAGSDIVCASVSTVVAVCQAMLEKYRCHWLAIDIEDSLILLAEGKNAAKILSAAIETIEKLARDYPQNVRVLDGRTGAVVIPGTAGEPAL